MLSDQFLQELKYRSDIEQVVGSYVNLRRRGRTLSGLCPFHSEKSPSFTVYPDTQSFFCFGCGAAGDVINFIRRIENLDYMEAVRLLAQRAGMQVPEDAGDDRSSRLRKRILELNRDAVQDAIGNAKHNGVKNARFFAADATRWIREAAAAGEKADVIFMDPPREGSTPEFLASVARMAPRRVVYVSCNPVTLARDLATLTKLGYKAEGFTPVDMFPHTEHIEVVCALSKASARRVR